MFNAGRKLTGPKFSKNCPRGYPFVMAVPGNGSNDDPRVEDERDMRKALKR